MGQVLEEQTARIRAQVGKRRVICGLSGGVDSSVVAALLHRAVPGQARSVFVDHGLLRRGEAAQVAESMREVIGSELLTVDARERFLGELRGIEDPEEKRKTIGRVFIVELVEPLRELFKDEVRSLGGLLGLSKGVLGRHPFPGPGLAVRILGPITEEAVETLAVADDIFLTELRQAGLYDQVWQAFAVLLPVRTVGVMGDGRTYDQVVALRAVTSTDGMTADWARLPDAFLARVSSRIVNEVKGVNRVVYDISTKPPATIEWE